MANADHLSLSGNKKRKRKDSSDNQYEYSGVALEQLQMNSLRRYKRHYKLQTRQGLTKSQLVETINYLIDYDTTVQQLLYSGGTQPFPLSVPLCFVKTFLVAFDRCL